jgi:hypothetical protein
MPLYTQFNQLINPNFTYLMRLDIKINISLISYNSESISNLNEINK